jgi:AcrR family transcriptional regulator
VPGSAGNSIVRSSESQAPRRMPAADRRKHLITVAMRLFATRGFSGTTTKAIAEAGGVSEAIIFRHFKCKEDLYGAILREKARQDGYDQTIDLLRSFARRDDDERLVFQLVLRTLESFARDPEFHRLMLYAALEGHDLTKVSRRIFGTPLFKLLHGYVARRQKAGAFRTGQPGILAFSMMALPLHFGMVTQVIGARRVDVSNHDLATTFTRIILDGMREPNAAQRKIPSNAGRARNARRKSSQ